MRRTDAFKLEPCFHNTSDDRLDSPTKSSSEEDCGYEKSEILMTGESKSLKFNPLDTSPSRKAKCK
jgi:hypothetical protein